MAASRCRHGFCLIIFSIFIFICCSLSAAADEDILFYSTRADTVPVRSSGSWYAYDYGDLAAGAYTSHSISNNEDFWEYTNHSIARGFRDLYNRLDLILSADNAINTKLTTIDFSISTLISKMWGSTSSPITIYRMNTTWDGGFATQQVNTIADALALDSINNMYAAYWSKLNNDALWAVQSEVADVETAVSDASSLAHSDSTSLGNKIFDSSSPTGNSAYYHTQTLQYESTAYPSYLVTTANGYKVATGADMGMVSSLRDYLDLINRNIIVQGNMLFNFSRTYTQDRYNIGSHTSTSWTVRSLADALTYGFSDLSNFTGRLASVFASDDDIQAREDADPQIQQAQEDFISSDGAASVKLSDMGSAKDVSSSLQSSLNTGVSPATSFSYFSSNSNLFQFFGDDCRANLDSAPVLRSDTFIDFYTPNFEMIGVAFSD